MLRGKMLYSAIGVMVLGMILFIVLFGHNPYHSTFVESRRIVVQDQDGRYYIAVTERNEVGESRLAELKEIK